MFLRHCARFFDYDWWVVKNNQLDLGLSLFVSIVDQWVMPLFFVLSGIGTWYAVGRRTGIQYVGDRFKRLAVPFIFGIFVIVPPQSYIDQVSRSQFAGSFIDYLPRYFEGFYSFWNGNSAHLWYLELLFIFSVVTLPFCLYLKRETPMRLISKMAVLLQKQGAIFLFAIPIAVMELFINWQPYRIVRTSWGAGGWSILTYLVFFVLGYLIASNEQFKMAIERHRLASLIAGLLTLMVGLIWFRSDTHIAFPSILRAFDTWFWIVAILGFGSKYLNFRSRSLSYANQAVLPFYVLHQTIIVMVGYSIAGWDMNVLAKYFVLSSLSFVLIMALYHFVIRPIGILRILFGFKIARPSRQPLIV
jgi:peptidoglycan/LPS O-acetylase OafA/YrhL